MAKITLKELRNIISDGIMCVMCEMLSPPEQEEAEELSKQPEYSSIQKFVDYKIESEEFDYSVVDLHALWMSLNRRNKNANVPLQQISQQLRSSGLTPITREPPKQVRGFTANPHDRWHGPGSLATHGGAGIDASTGRGTVKGRTI